MRSTAAPARRALSMQGRDGASTASSGQPSLWDAVKANAIQRAEDHADPDWKDAALAAIVCAASTCEDFTADDVRCRIGPEFSTPTPSALGPVFLAAARAGLIRKTCWVRPSRDPIRHRDLAVWTKA